MLRAWVGALWARIEAPISAAEHERQAKVIRPVYWIGLGLSVAVGLLQVLSMGALSPEALPSLITSGYMLLYLPLVLRGRERTAGALVLASSALVNAVVVARTGGILSSAMPTYQVLVIAGGLVLGPHLVAPLVLLSLGIYSAVLWGQAEGWVACPVDLAHAQVYALTDAGLTLASGVVVYFAAQALRERAAFNESVVLALPGTIYVYDLVNDRTRWTSRSLVAPLGWDPHLAWQQSFPKIMHPDDLRAAPTQFERRRHAKDGEILTNEFRLRDTSGRWHTFESRDTVYRRGADGQVQEFIGYLQDVTEHRLAEEAMARGDRLLSLGQLAGGVAHDFNNVLAPIVGNAELIRRELAADDIKAQAAQAILRSAERARDLTRRMLSLSRSSALDLRPADLNEVVGAFLPLLQRSLRSGLSLGFEPHPGPLPIKADPSQLERALLNLALNAQDAIEGHADLRVATGLEEGWAVLRFEDPGPGMTPEVKARAFEPFFTTKEPGKGTGLGLSSVHAIVQAHQGRLQLESEPGQGCRFSFRFPLHEAEPSAPVPAGPWPGALLLVEDEDDLRAVLLRQLQVLGWRVLAAAHAEEALALSAAEPGPIPLLLTDIRLPGKRGPELGRLLRAQRPELRTAYMSGFAEANEVDGPLLAKPFNLEQLQGLLDEMKPR